MAYLNPEVLDDGLEYATANGTRLDLCSAEPGSYAQVATLSLGYVAVTTSAPNNGVTSGRKVDITAAPSAGAITATGTATFWALTDGVGVLVAVGNLSAGYPVENGDDFSIDTITVTLPSVSGAPIPTNIRYIAPTAIGVGDGLSWASAAALTDINAMIAAVGSGGVVGIASHLGEYNQTSAITLSAHGGSERVTIMGMDGSNDPTLADIVGNRADWASPATEAGRVNASAFGGNTLFAAAAGIGNLNFKFLNFKRLGRIIDFSAITASGFLFEDCAAYNVRDGIYLNVASEITDCILRRVNAIGFSKKFVRFRGTSHTWQILDCGLDSRWQDMDAFAVGIECYDTAHDLIIDGGYTRNCHDTSSAYWNGDGVSSERGNYNIAISNHNASGCTDGGYDMKAENVVLDGCIAQDNKRNFRIWGGLGTPVAMNDCQSLAPHGRGGGSVHHVWLDGGGDPVEPGGKIDITNFTASGGDTGITALYIDGTNATMAFVNPPDITLTSGSVMSTTLESGSTITGLSGGSTEPAAFTVGMWTLGSNNVSGELALNILGLPGNGGSAITELQYRIDGGTWIIMSGTGTGTRELTGLTDDIEYEVEIRAINAIGPSLTSDIKSATPGYVAPEIVVLHFDGSALLAGGTPVDDAVGAPALVLGSTAVVVDGGIEIGGGTGDVRFPNRPGFTFDGMFTVKMKYTKANWNRSAGADFIVSFWHTTGNQRGWVISVTPSNTFIGGFGNGGGASGNVVDALPTPALPVPIPAGEHEVMFDRGADNFTRVYLDGVMVAKSPVTATLANPNNGVTAVRVSGSMSGNTDPGPSILHFLEVRNGEALCGSDAGYIPTP